MVMKVAQGCMCIHYSHLNQYSRCMVTRVGACNRQIIYPGKKKKKLGLERRIMDWSEDCGLGCGLGV